MKLVERLKKINVLGVAISICTYDSVVEEIIRLAKRQKSAAVTACATHLIMTSFRDDELARMVNEFDIVAPDGQPVRWALNILGNAGLSDRVYGPELMLRICERSAREGIKIFLYGSTVEVVTRLKDNFQEKIPDLLIAGIQPSRFRPLTEEEEHHDIAMINNSGSNICFVGLGCPRQEKWVYEHRGRVNAVMVAVGAAFDFHAGTLRQAPKWMQKRGLEWLFRLIMEPRRLWKRYILNNPQYLLLLFLQWTGLSKFPISKPSQGQENK